MQPLPPRWLIRSFHQSCSSRLTHYEALNVQPNASLAEIKRSFYALSKTHHPDHNPSDPTAAERFARLSEAYHILLHPSKRALYDASLPGASAQNPARPYSYHGTYKNPAGGRPASGLSRRRGAFRGPPPSFFRSGGYGAHADRRTAAHDESTGGAEEFARRWKPGDPFDHGSRPRSAADQEAHQRLHHHRHEYGGMGPGHSPFHGAEEAPDHFDREGHTRTQTREDVRRARRAERKVRAEQDSATRAKGVVDVVQFFVVAATLGLVVSATAWAWGLGRGRDDKERKAQKRRAVS